MDEAIEYFTKLNKKDLIKAMLMQLATAYFEQGKYDKSVDTYKRLISKTRTLGRAEYQTRSSRRTERWVNVVASWKR